MTRTTKRAGKGKRQHAAMMLWMAFANLFDPPKAAAVERIDDQRKLGSEAGRAARAPAGPPVAGEDGR